jgi:uncharacterized membrane protein
MRTWDEMTGVQKYLRTTLIGGVLVALPIFLLTNLFLWLLGWLNNALRPLSRFYINTFDLSQWLGDTLAIATALGMCFVLGVIVALPAGHRAFTWLERHTLQRLPGYNPIKEIVGYLGRNDRNPFSQPVLVSIAVQTQMVGFLTDEDGDYCTVFVPTGPNPTTGLVMHLRREQIHALPATSTEAMKTILACGAGAQQILSRDRLQSEGVEVPDSEAGR